MGWIKKRIEAEHRKYYSMPNGLEKCNIDWARLAEQKIIGQLVEDLKKVHRKTQIHIPLDIFALVAQDVKKGVGVEDE